jgi:hypothetical protein
MTLEPGKDASKPASETGEGADKPVGKTDTP